jgi:hypothetical protein
MDRVRLTITGHITMSYSLTIKISQSSLQNIYNANQTVSICKVITSFVSSADVTANAKSGTTPTVVWLAFTPLENNTVNWDDTYSAYVTGTAIVTGNTIFINSTKSATLGFLYTFSGGAFTAAPYTAGQDTFNIANQQSNFNFGLAQKATINGTSLPSTPLNCIPVLYNQQAMFTPSEAVYIFLSTCSAGGTFIPILPSTALTVPLTSKKPSVTIGFDDTTNSFYIAD